MKEVIQFEDFAKDAEQVREAVIADTFTSETGPDGALYTGISKHPVPHWFDCLSECLRKKIKPLISCFRLNLKGELPHSWVHSDGICAKFATVLYLNTPEQCKGGTAFWKHRQLGIDRLPAGETPQFYRQMEKDWKVLDLWEPVGMIAMHWNRLIIYPTSLFHSRFPFEGFGSNSRDGRLIWICFYDLVNE